MGGISSAHDVIEMMVAGASAVAIGCQNLVDPYACYKIIQDLPKELEKLGVEAGEKVTFDQVLAVSDNGMKVGADVANATVEASVVKEGRAKKVIVYKYKRKSGYHKKNGHRQQYTAVKIEKINA